MKEDTLKPISKILREMFVPIGAEGVRELFKNKKDYYSDGEYWCTGCNSYRPIPQNEGDHGYCDLCCYVSTNKILIHETFDHIMERWDNTTHKESVKKIPYLKGTSGKGYQVRGFSYVDAEDYEELSKLLWVFAGGYVKANYSKANRARTVDEIFHADTKAAGMHNLVLKRVYSMKEVTDHINRHRMDNRKFNLRVCTSVENNYNKKKYKNSGNQEIGLYKHTEPRNKPWRARLYVDGKSYTKHFKTKEEASEGYNELLRKHRNTEFNVYN